MIKAIIFDCFGVIKIDPFVQAYSYFGGEPVKDEKWAQEVYTESNLGKIPATAPVFAKRLGISTDEWIKKTEEVSTIDEDMLAYITDLRKQYKTALLSNIGIGGLERHFMPDTLNKYFDVTFASGDEGIAKPEARAYEIVADRLGVRVDECIFIDDRQVFVDGAERVGMRAILYRSLEQLKKELEPLLK